MKWVKASEKLPDNHKNIVSRFVGESGKNFMSAIADGYFYADGGATAYHPSLIEYLDETTCGDGWDGERELDEMAKEKDYWFNRCYHAEKFIEESPCDPDITPDQVEAHKNWKDSIKR